MKFSVSTLAAAAVLAAAPLAGQAEDMPFTAQVAPTAEYRFRGHDQSDPAAAVLPAIPGDFASVGPVSASHSRLISSTGFGVEVAQGIERVAHPGATQFSASAESNDSVNFSDYKLGADSDVGSGFTVGAACVGATTEGDRGDIDESRAVLSLSKAL